MRNKFPLIVGSLIVCLVSPVISFSCSIAISPIKGFDPAEYVFTGVVMDFVGPLQSKKFLQKAWGLKIKLEDSVYLPKTPTSYFEVFPYELWADCSIVGTSKEELAKYYPIGSKVKVIAKEAKALPHRLPNGNIRLEDLPSSLGSISRNYYEDGRRMTDAAAVFDYQSYKRVGPNDYVRDFMPFLTAHSLLPEFELRKDLFRLRSAKTEAVKIKILERLMYYPRPSIFDFESIIKSYIDNPQTAKTLIEKWNARNPINRIQPAEPATA
ncbi:MAG: hypothetical protein QOD75_4031 [Blastocatellia bacterium]|jgi:hypothetical protein|nr:hypothetical protein [Blastocatellia bacterium]